MERSSLRYRLLLIRDDSLKVDKVFFVSLRLIRESSIEIRVMLALPRGSRVLVELIRDRK